MNSLSTVGSHATLLRGCHGEAFLGFAVTLAVWSGVLALSPPLEARTWSGTVYDTSTGLPIPGAVIKAGTRGRVDAFTGYEVASNAAGRFTVTWPEDEWDLRKAASINHYLRVTARAGDWVTQANTGYWNCTVIRAAPTKVDVWMHPRPVHIRGEFIQADGSPLAGHWINLTTRAAADLPFGIRSGQRSDENGRFAFSPAKAYVEDDAGWPATIYDVPPDLAPDPGEDLATLQTSLGDLYEFAVRAQNVDYPLPRAWVRPGIDDSISTWVTIRIPADPATTPPEEAVTGEFRQSWRPSGWVHFLWPYAYALDAAEWWFFPDHAALVLGIAPAEEWTRLDDTGIGDGWLWTAWPWLYDFRTQSWYAAYDFGIPSWCVNLRLGSAFRLGF
jgi:hypothetical protein